MLFRTYIWNVKRAAADDSLVSIHAYVSNICNFHVHLLWYLCLCVLRIRVNFIRTRRTQKFPRARLSAIRDRKELRVQCNIS